MPSNKQIGRGLHMAGALSVDDVIKLHGNARPLFTADTRKPRRRNAQPERALHTHVGQMLSWLKPNCVWFPVPNGTDVGAKMGAILRGQWKVKPGVSDWIFMWGLPIQVRVNGGLHLLDLTGLPCEPAGFSTSGAIELKIGNQPQSDDQKIFEADCKLQGIPYRIAKTVDEMVKILEEWNRLARGTHRRIRGFNPQ